MIEGLFKFTELIEAIKDKFDRLEKENSRLKIENKNLKSEAYKDQELARMKDELKRAQDDLLRGFGISEDELSKIKEWQKSHPGFYEYHFSPTGLGTVGEIIETKSGEKFEFCSL